MNGVILYADDDVLNDGTYENKLFQKFNRSLDYSILPITNISDLEKTISSISTFRALLLDWTFKKPSEDEEMPEMNENPLDILRSKKIYVNKAIDGNPPMFFGDGGNITNEIRNRMKNL